MIRSLQRAKQTVREKLRRFLQIPPNYIGDNGCIRAAASFVAWNQIPGDYLEFGVWRGYSFSIAWQEIHRQRQNHFRFGYESPEYLEWKRSNPRFFAFDCFEGLPGGTSEPRMVDYQAGSYSCSEREFRSNIESTGVRLDDVILVKGLYQNTCTAETRQKHGLSKAAIVMIDCDLYSSTVPVLEFLTPLVQQGTILIFDDWFRFQGSPNHGEQLACKEWLERNTQIELREFWRQGPQAVSFIVNLK